MARAYIAFGSNQDNPIAQLQRARAALSGLPGLREIAASPVYRTPPWGFVEQPDFYNAVIAYDCNYRAEDLLRHLQALELAQRRQRSFKNAPRTLDLDIVLYGDCQQDSPELTLPHPRLHERAFVLQPLAEIAPELQIPGKGRVAELLAGVDCSGQQRLQLADWAVGAAL